jgi:BirA family biotin operon repressor/biotin-[acetyl-CoA-carboxylase] ligase
MTTSNISDLPGAWFLELDETESTQLDARRICDEGAPHGSMVVARRQTNGRGRLGRTWHGPTDGIFISMVLRPMLSAQRAPRLTLFAACAVLGALDDVGINARVKWPNDICIECHDKPEGRLGPYRKVGGLLVEVVAMTSLRIDACILGIGLNVQPPDATRENGGWPDDVALTAGALSDAGLARSRDDVVTALRRHLRFVSQAGDDALYARVLDGLRRRSATLGRRVTVDDEGAPLLGRAIDLDEDGALLVRDDDGVVHAVRAGDVWLK